jgi:hypothetical protein
VLLLIAPAAAALGDRGELERRVTPPSFRLDVGDTGDRGDLDLRRPPLAPPPVDLGDEPLVDDFELFRSLPSFGDDVLVFLVVVVVVC